MLARGSRARLPLLLVAALGMPLIGGCGVSGSANPNTVAIEFEVDGDAQRVAVSPGDLGCYPGEASGGVGFEFSNEPFTQVAVSAGNPGSIEVAIFDDDSVLVFASDDADVRTTALPDGATEFTVTAEANDIARVELAGAEAGSIPDLAGAPRFAGSLSATLRCVVRD